VTALVRVKCHRKQMISGQLGLLPRGPRSPDSPIKSFASPQNWTYFRLMLIV
jgi:hypothetical protein